MTCRFCGKPVAYESHTECNWCWYGQRVDPPLWFDVTTFVSEKMREEAREISESYQRAMTQGAKNNG